MSQSIKEIENFLFDNFELLFSKEPKDNDIGKRIEDRFTIDDPDKHDILKIEFTKLRKSINDEIKMIGGNITSLTYIKEYITDKIRNIIPRE